MAIGTPYGRSEPADLAIARMNMFLHDIEEFDVLRGDTLAEPKFIENDRLKQFDVILPTRRTPSKMES